VLTPQKHHHNHGSHQLLTRIHNHSPLPSISSRCCCTQIGPVPSHRRPKRPASLHHRHDLITPSLPRRRAKLDSPSRRTMTMASQHRRSSYIKVAPCRLAAARKKER
jgi:hypothetical protein